MKPDDKRLKLLDLPVFSGARQLASLMHVDSQLLVAFAKFSDRFYKRYWIKKRNGDLRHIKQPRRDLKAVQAWILRNILDKQAPSQYAMAYIKDRNISHNVKPHSSNHYFLCVDIEDFFPSVSVARVQSIYSLMGYSKRPASLLASLCCCEGSLPQGAVTSPALCNLVARKLDRRIAGFVARRNITYTRYSDDIVLSCNDHKVLCQSLPKVLSIIISEHFRPHPRKLRMLGPRMRCLITGLVKNNSGPGFGIGKKKKREMRAVMHHFLFSSDKDIQYKSEPSIVGWLSFLKGVDANSHRQMMRYWNSLRQKAGLA